MRTLINCGYLVTMDGEAGDIVGGEILIEKDRIVAVGKSLDAHYDTKIDASEMIVLPGLVNAHLHIWQGALRGIGSEWSGADYFRIVSPRIAPLYEPRDNYLTSLLGALAQIGDGVTTIGDYCHNLTSLEQVEASVDGLEQSGIRAVFYAGCGDAASATHKDPHQQIRESVSALRAGRLANDDRRVSLGYAMHGPEYSTWETTLADIRFANNLDLRSTSHSSVVPESRKTIDGYLQMLERSLIGPRHSIIHGNALHDREFIPLLDAGVPLIATCMQEYRSMKPDPVMNRMRARGILPALGTDNEMIAGGCLIREMQTALLVARNGAHRKNAESGRPPFSSTPVRSREALEWVTRGGARALGLESEIGSLSPGKKADITMFRSTDGNLCPLYDPIFALAELAHGGNVDTVIIDGKVCKQGGKLIFPSALLAKHKSELREVGTKLLNKAGYSLQAG